MPSNTGTCPATLQSGGSQADPHQDADDAWEHHLQAALLSLSFFKKEKNWTGMFLIHSAARLFASNLLSTLPRYSIE